MYNIEEFIRILNKQLLASEIKTIYTDTSYYTVKYLGVTYLLAWSYKYSLGLIEVRVKPIILDDNNENIDLNIIWEELGIYPTQRFYVHPEHMESLIVPICKYITSNTYQEKLRLAVYIANALETIEEREGIYIGDTYVNLGVELYKLSKSRLYEDK